MRKYRHFWIKIIQAPEKPTKISLSKFWCNSANIQYLTLSVLDFLAFLTLPSHKMPRFFLLRNSYHRSNVGMGHHISITQKKFFSLITRCGWASGTGPWISANLTSAIYTNKARKGQWNAKESAHTRRAYFGLLWSADKGTMFTHNPFQPKHCI